MVEKLISSAVRYAQIQVEYSLLPVDEKRDLENEKTIAHIAFISSCDILAKNRANHIEDNSWRTLIGRDRKENGDFAWIRHLMTGLKAR